MKCKSKLQWGTTEHPLGGYYSSKEKKTSVGENLDNLGPLCVASENVK